MALRASVISASACSGFAFMMRFASAESESALPNAALKVGCGRLGGRPLSFRASVAGRVLMLVFDTVVAGAPSAPGLRAESCVHLSGRML